MPGNLEACECRGKPAALAAVVCPEHARQESKQFPEPRPGPGAEFGQKQHHHSACRQSRCQITLKRTQTERGYSLPQQRPDGRGAEVKRNVRSRRVSERPIK